MKERFVKSMKRVHIVQPSTLARSVLTIATITVLPLLALAFTTVVHAQTTAPEDDRAQIDVIVSDAPLDRVPEELTVRARVTKIEPAEPTEIRWRTGGEGLGGSVNRGLMPRVVAPVPADPDVDGKPKAKDDLEDLIDAEEKPNRNKQPPTDQRLAVGDWSIPVTAGTFTRGGAPRLAFVTFTAGSGGQLATSGATGGRQVTGGSKNVELELEFSFRGQPIKTIRETGPEGGTIGIVIPYGLLAGGKAPTDAAFRAALVGLREHATRRAEVIEAMPWAKGPKPKQFAMITAMNGYGEGQYYGIRYANREIVEAEARTLRAIGINGFQGGPAFLIEQAFERSGLGAPFHGGLETNIFGYPVPAHDARREVPGAGCPYHPDVPARSKAGVAESLEQALSLRVNSVWGITVDEIGAVVDRAPEGKSHLAVCPRCQAGFQEFLKAEGLKPDEFGATDWTDVKPIDIWDAKGPRPWLNDKTAARLAYWTLRFNCYSSAKLFEPHRTAFAAANEVKQQAIAAGETNTSAARQPWVYAAAMRGNTFLMGGHSLDFFDFYRYADNAFIYETSNRDARIWQWDSYLCDVGRVLHDRMQKEFGILVKPHRGAPVQRALAAVARNAKMINWYTYGPEYAKGDSFAEKLDAIKLVGQANDLIGRAEDVLYDTHWPEPPRIAIVKPRSSELWMQLGGDPVGPAAWENAKWIYTALTHAHLAVDPIDEGIMERDDLSQYRVIYVNGPQLTRASAAKLAAWVEAGGTLWTSGGGLARDEYNEPLDALLPTLGLEKRDPPQMWRRVATYGATQLSPPALLPGVKIPDDAAVVAGEQLLAGPVKLTIGREVLDPVNETEVLARFADGGAAMTRHAFGKGQAYVVGFFPGLEYMTPLLSSEFDMGRDFDPQCRAFITAATAKAVDPFVNTSDPNVEGVLVENNRTGKRAILLMNWTYRVAATRTGGGKGRPGRSSVVAYAPLEKVSVSFPVADIKSVRSVALDATLKPTADGDSRRTVTLPRLAEGDVLLLE